MKNKKAKGASFSFLGALLFFIVIAFIIQIAVLVYEYIRTRTDNKALIAVLILIVIFILSAFCVIFDLIRRKITVQSPTEKILEATQKIAEGDFNTRLEITHEYSKYNQYDLIMENLNLMAAELGKNEVLKMDFISNLSHEIKTPLAVIQNSAELLQNETLGGENLSKDERERATKSLITACKRVTNLISNILKLNKLENQQLQEKKERFNLTEALAECVLQYENAIESKGLELECDFEDVTAVSSKSLLDIVWSNLISNAVKFTESGGKIKVTLKKSGENAKITVEDTGAGMTPEAGSRIFEKFYQADGSHKQEGNGLGLALVKRVIDILGGEISVHSELGNGSVFTITLKGVKCELI